MSITLVIFYCEKEEIVDKSRENENLAETSKDQNHTSGGDLLYMDNGADPGVEGVDYGCFEFPGYCADPVEMAKNVSKSNVLFLISASGSKVDVSGYIGTDYPNVILDYAKAFADLNITESRVIIDLGEEKIEQATEIDLENMAAELARF